MIKETLFVIATTFTAVTQLGAQIQEETSSASAVLKQFSGAQTPRAKGDAFSVVVKALRTDAPADLPMRDSVANGLRAIAVHASPKDGLLGTDVVAAFTMMVSDERPSVHREASKHLQGIARTAGDSGLRAAAIIGLAKGQARPEALAFLKEQATNKSIPNFSELAIRMIADNFGPLGARWLLELESSNGAGSSSAQVLLQMKKTELQKAARH